MQRITSNQSDMNTRTELIPAVAAPTKSASPVVVPASVRRPARKPLVSVLARINDMLGPGVRPKRMQVAMKATRTSGDKGRSPGGVSLSRDSQSSLGPTNDAAFRSAYPAGREGGRKIKLMHVSSLGAPVLAEGRPCA